MPNPILSKLKNETSLKISPGELEDLLDNAELLSESDPVINQSIRLLRLEGRWLVQEYSFSGDIYVRPLDSREAAEAFIQSRLDTYERMWDGCGCRINFEK